MLLVTLVEPVLLEDEVPFVEFYLVVFEVELVTLEEAEELVWLPFEDELVTLEEDDELLWLPF